MSNHRLGKLSKNKTIRCQKSVTLKKSLMHMFQLGGRLLACKPILTPQSIKISQIEEGHIYESCVLDDYNNIYLNIQYIKHVVTYLRH